MIGNAPATPGVTENLILPDAPEPATASGASTTFGVTTSGIRTVVPAPFQVRKPLAAWSNSALLLVKVTRKVRVSPAALNDRMDGLTDTFTPGMLAWPGTDPASPPSPGG